MVIHGPAVRNRLTLSQHIATVSHLPIQRPRRGLCGGSMLGYQERVSITVCFLAVSHQRQWLGAAHQGR